MFLCMYISKHHITQYHPRNVVVDYIYHKVMSLQYILIHISHLYSNNYIQVSRM